MRAREWGDEAEYFLYIIHFLVQTLSVNSERFLLARPEVTL